METDKKMDFEKILNDVHGTGLFHVIMLGFCSMLAFISGMELQTMVFMHYTPDFNCTDPIIAGKHGIKWLSESQFSGLSKDIKYHQNIRTLNESAKKQCYGLYLDEQQPNTELFKCRSWTYDQSQMRRTVATQFNLICDQSTWIPGMETAYLCSIAIGYLLAGLSDIFGRKKPIILLTTCELIICIATPFASSPLILLILRCLRGLSVSTSYIGINLVSELCPVQYRALYGNIYWLLWSFGYMTAAGIAYLVTDWYYLRIWSLIFSSVYLFYPFIICESPRWLCLHGRAEEATSIFRRIARYNRVKLPESYFDSAKNYFTKEYENMSTIRNGTVIDVLNNTTQKVTQHKDKYFHVFMQPNLRLRTLVFWSVHGTIALVYYGLVTNATFASENVFFNVFLMGIIELPTSIASWLASAYMGRRLSSSLLLGLTGVAVALTEAFHTINPTAQTFAAVFGKFTLTTVYCILILYITELYPTSIRSICFFCVVTVGNFASAAAPSVNQLKNVIHFLPPIIFSGLCALAAILTLAFLPETQNCPLPQTVKQAENLKRGQEDKWSQEMMRQTSQCSNGHAIVTKEETC